MAAEVDEIFLCYQSVAIEISRSPKILQQGCGFQRQLALVSGDKYNKAVPR
jgi:hypothetical protein